VTEKRYERTIALEFYYLADVVSLNSLGRRTRLAQLARLQSQVVQLQQELDHERRKHRTDSPKDVGDSGQLDESMAEESMPIADLAHDASFVAHNAIPPLQPSITLDVEDQAEQSAAMATNSSTAIRQDGSHFYGGAGSAYLLVSLISAHEHLHLGLQRPGCELFVMLTLHKVCLRMFTPKTRPACTMAWIPAPITTTWA
jgi:hypothetical protein